MALRYQVDDNLDELVISLENYRISPNVIKGWARAAQQRERKAAQQAIRDRRRGPYYWARPLYQTGRLFRGVSSIYRYYGNPASDRWSVSIVTPVPYAAKLAAHPHLGFLRPTRQEIAYHWRDLVARVNRSITFAGGKTQGRYRLKARPSGFARLAELLGARQSKTRPI